MILISPLLLYYNRYIRHDTPSIFFALIMVYCILQYLNGSPRFRRRAYWLYIFAAAMILNLGSKETAFIYIAIFGSFLCILFPDAPGAASLRPGRQAVLQHARPGDPCGRRHDAGHVHHR